ncbi:ATP-binding cassette subfamily C protein [Stackebrandtia endophytica]|uniref:ATP-binding cassette subfamily C protein n=1 Tax=Stackebrandtia endophytica TaxID=1496996 RepID=A0A543AQ09_9ACTN|nr:ABC transporter ATP-binding protein [Stackebrandtia endophytica]TQL74616.1 ATP-binding cassette subfamily C protein [Stackebrandtia endophytica]
MSQATDGHLPVADKRTVRRSALRLLRTDPKALTVVIGLYCAASLAALAGPWLLGQIIDHVGGTDTSVSTVDRLAATFALFALLQLVLNRWARYTAHRFGERALARLRENFVERTLDLPIATVEQVGSGDLMTRSSGDVATVGQMVRQALPEMFLALVQAVFIVAAVFLVHPLLGLCVLFAAPTLWWFTRWYLRRARTAYLAEGAATTEMSQTLSDTVEGARTVETLRLTRHRIALGDNRLKTVADTRTRTLFLRSVWFPAADFSYPLPIAAVLLFGGLLFFQDWLTLGAVITATLYLQQLADPLDTVLMWVEQLQRGSASYARVEGVGMIDTSRDHTDRVPADDRVVVTDVRYAYRDGHDVLNGVTVTVEPGEYLAIVGPSGAGKSTLGRLVAGIDRPRTGSVTVGGVAVSDLSPAKLRARVALVTQEHHIFLGTLRDNLALARPDSPDRDILAALEAVEADWLAKLPDGLDTELGAGGHALDAAQAQQVALARLVLADPHTLILDEATAQLDPTTARQAERSLAAVLRGRTVISIAHRLHTAHDADRIAVVDGGLITELGSHDELIAADGSYAALWRSWHGTPDTAAN